MDGNAIVLERWIVDVCVNRSHISSHILHSYPWVALSAGYELKHYCKHAYTHTHTHILDRLSVLNEGFRHYTLS